MDPLLVSLTADQLFVIEGVLANDEASTDDELRLYFIQLGLSSMQADRALLYRERYLNQTYLTGLTPICQGDDALHVDPTLGDLTHD